MAEIGFNLNISTNLFSACIGNRNKYLDAGISSFLDGLCPFPVNRLARKSYREWAMERRGRVVDGRHSTQLTGTRLEH